MPTTYLSHNMRSDISNDIMLSAHLLETKFNGIADAIHGHMTSIDGKDNARFKILNWYVKV